MPDKGTKKKVTRVEGGDASPATPERETRVFEASAESKGKAKSFRLYALIAWIVAIGFEAGAIFLLQKPPIRMVWLIVLIVVDLVFAIIGSLLWKKANRFDPASEKNKVKFFIQSQLGVIISVIAFLPLVILIFTNKDMNGKQKGIVGAIAVVAMLIAGVTGIDFNPPSQEQYAAQTSQVESLTGANTVYWTKAGTRYHLYSDCPHINTRKTDEIFSGTVAKARELKNISELCKTCEARARKDKTLEPGQATEPASEPVPAPAAGEEETTD
ncbi:MAG TPA: hypothetical protein PKK12_10655 [Candidatus Aminicenantes bacterium]|nr:hypothetical protein [Candidatus Aminicenantes bacterium]